MAKTVAKSHSNSLKGKIQLAMAALAFFIGATGLASYFISQLFGNSFYAVFIPFLFLAVTTVFFGRWLVNEITAPVEKVSLLAKSFDRGVSTTLPKTTGSAETDELLQTIARLHALLHKLVGSMDEVASGNLEVVFSPNIDSDRTSQTFQKLLAKVSESIHAKQELEKLQNAVAKISEEIAPLKAGNLETKIETEADETYEIAQTLNYLAEQLAEIVTQVKTNSAQTRASAFEFQKSIRAIIHQDENRVQEMNQASVTLKQVPNIIHKISEEFSQSSLSAGQSIEKAQRGNQNAQANLNAIANLRRQMQEAIKRIQRLSERSQEINKISKMVEDLAQRTSMVALNASVQANELGDAGRGFIVVSREVERLAERAGNTNKHISSLNKTIQAEITELENSLYETVGEAADLSKFAIETGNALSELEKYAAGILNLQNKIAVYSREQTEETQKAFQVFVAGISETENSLVSLKESVSSVVKISSVMEDLQAQVSDFKISNPAENAASINYSNYASVEADTTV